MLRRKYIEIVGILSGITSLSGCLGLGGGDNNNDDDNDDDNNETGNDKNGNNDEDNNNENGTPNENETENGSENDPPVESNQYTITNIVVNQTQFVGRQDTARLTIDALTDDATQTTVSVSMAGKTEEIELNDFNENGRQKVRFKLPLGDISPGTYTLSAEVDGGIETDSREIGVFERRSQPSIYALFTTSTQSTDEEEPVEWENYELHIGLFNRPSETVPFELNDDGRVVFPHFLGGTYEVGLSLVSTAEQNNIFDQELPLITPIDGTPSNPINLTASEHVRLGSYEVPNGVETQVKIVDEEGLNYQNRDVGVSLPTGYIEEDFGETNEEGKLTVRGADESGLLVATEESSGIRLYQPISGDIIGTVTASQDSETTVIEFSQS